MKFEEALKAMRKGKLIRLPEWEKSIGLTIYEKNLFFVHGIDVPKPKNNLLYAIMLDEITREDWEILELIEYWEIVE